MALKVFGCKSTKKVNDCFLEIHCPVKCWSDCGSNCSDCATNCGTNN